jgi:hypothetical protein
MLLRMPLSRCAATGASIHVRTNWRMSSKSAPPFCSLVV